MVRDTIEERHPPVATQILVQEVYPTPPRTTPTGTSEDKQVPVPQNHMQQVVTIVCGDDLRSWCSVHEQTLCKHSEKMSDLSLGAVATREAYSKINEWLVQIESITVLGASPEQFEKEKLRAKLIPLILKIWEHFPLTNYQNTISKVIRETVDKQYTNGNLMPSAERPKTLKIFQGLNPNKRLHLINSEGLLDVAEEACVRLQKVKAAEKQLAKKNVSKTWAQGQLILRGASEKSVVSLVEWAYHKTLDYENADHLYDLWALATRLRFDVLAEECMDRLHQSASASLGKALSDGVPLRSLLGLHNEQDGPDATASSDDVVAAAFHRVLKDDKPPEKLSELIIDALARGMDSDMWVQVQSMVSLDTACKLIDFMIAYRDVKVEGSSNDVFHIKREGPQGGGNAQPESTEPQQQPVLTG
ncbi:hypothetical protein E8E12_005746 [Didymella heteroderae]|uniref:Uncharacterized protein n=1 Tax=Didymella heteroderae TaxID=1769908 RepID=A0A9P4WL96_9PLEO|nr:hypothetical protein E8E12_005746 [Didymella heteroderae]